MKAIRSVLLLVFPIYLFSCTPKILPNYLDKATDSTLTKEVVIPEMRIQKNDVLSIRVYSSSLDPAADAPYNLPTIVTSTAGSSSSGQGATQGGFLVDTKGNIEYPRLGSFHAEGLTRDELAEQIKKRLIEPVELLRNPVVIVRFQNLKITILGEVNTQGVISIPTENVNIIEAIGLAGGVTEYGLKNSVRVVREVDGKREMGVIDLSAGNVFESPYYHLKQNDMIFIDPTPRKARKADQDLVLQRITFGLTLITAFSLLYNLFQ